MFKATIVVAVVVAAAAGCCCLVAHTVLLHTITAPRLTCFLFLPQPSRHSIVSDNDGITDAIERGCTSALCDTQNACELTAYWDHGNSAPCGGDNNKNWCDNHGSDSVNCPMNKGQSSTAHG